MVAYIKKFFMPLVGLTIIIIGVLVYINLFGIETNAGNEERPVGTIISSRRLKEMSRSLPCRGDVELIETNNGNYVFYISEAYIDAMPANIYLSNKTSFRTQLESFGMNVDLGQLPHYAGNFSVSIPDTVDVSNYNTVVIVHGISKAIQGYARI